MKKLNSKSQRGRSMVEMLGVLAIVGVLSVGGVYGYGVAMKKHKANEALHKASMLATTVSAYAMSNDGNLPSTITDFANLGYETSVTDDGTKFKLTISGLDDGVCKQMQSSKGGIAQGVECDETTGNATITYYKNLATNDEEGKNSPTGGNSGTSDPLCKDVKCETGEECVGGNCIKSKTTDGSCAKNSDCDDWCANNKGVDDYGCYCQISANDYNWDPDWTDCRYNDFVGTCQTITNEEYRQGFSDKRVFTWWSTKNFCAAINKSMATTQTFCYDYSGGSSCMNMGDDFYWLQECWGADPDNTCNDNSCFAYNVNDGHLDAATYDRADDTAIAVCE